MTISPDIVFIRKNQFKWIIVEDFCVKRYPQLKLLIIVHTAIEHFDRRQIYRDMYGEKFYQKVNYHRCLKLFRFNDELNF